MEELLGLMQGYLIKAMVLIPVALLILGWMLKSTPKVPSWVIPWVLAAFGVAAGLVITHSPETSMGAWLVGGTVQGLIAAAMSQLMYQLYRQTARRKECAAEKQ